VHSLTWWVGTLQIGKLSRGCGRGGVKASGAGGVPNA
jgi:hypothetical protein